MDRVLAMQDEGGELMMYRLQEVLNRLRAFARNNLSSTNSTTRWQRILSWRLKKICGVGCRPRRLDGRRG